MVIQEEMHITNLILLPQKITLRLGIPRHTTPTVLITWVNLFIIDLTDTRF